MAKMINRPLQTFSVAFKDRAFSELDYARQVSRAIGADAHEVIIDEQDYFGALPRLIWHEDEPIAHTSSVPLYFVSRLAAEHVKVVLTGEGSDELLAGYARYRKTVYNLALGSSYHRWTTEGLRSFVRRTLELSLPSRAREKLKRTFL